MTPARSGLNSTAEEVARWIAAEALTGAPGCDSFTTLPIRHALRLTPGQLNNALSELTDRGYIRPDRTLADGAVQDFFAEWTLFFQFDPHVKSWTSSDDAREVAKELVARAPRDVKSRELEVNLGWSPRRLNPAMGWLEQHRKATFRKPSGSAPFAFSTAQATDATKRFVDEAA
jgi:hypothetical protein